MANHSLESFVFDSFMCVDVHMSFFRAGSLVDMDKKDVQDVGMERYCDHLMYIQETLNATTSSRYTAVVICGDWLIVLLFSLLNKSLLW